MKKNILHKINQIEPDFNKREEQELLKVIRSGWISESITNKQFEETVRKFLNVSYVATVPSGTQALTIACLAIGIKREDEVIMPDFTMAGTITGTVLAGGKPVFVDVSEIDLTIEVSKIEKAITKRTKAIMPVHINGRTTNMTAILRLAKKYGLFVIEDAAQAFGSKIQNKYLGTIGDIGCFSFSVPKIVTTGQGGMVVTNNKNLYERIIQLKDHGRRKKGLDIHDTLGFNFKFTNLQAALGIAQMEKVEKNIKKKKKIYKSYYSLLKKIPQVKFIKTDLTQTVPWFIDILVPEREKLVAYLTENEVETRIFYPPMHSQIAFKNFVAKKDNFAVTEKIANEGLWLPSSVNLSTKQIRYICKKIKDFYGQNPS